MCSSLARGPDLSVGSGPRKTITLQLFSGVRGRLVKSRVTSGMHIAIQRVPSLLGPFYVQGLGVSYEGYI